MHVAITSDPEIPVPPRLYGGIERVIAMLAAELTGRGHRVTLFAHPDSTAAAELIPWCWWLAYFSDELQEIRPEFGIVHRPGFMQRMLLLPQYLTPGTLLRAAVMPDPTGTLLGLL